MSLFSSIGIGLAAVNGNGLAVRYAVRHPQETDAAVKSVVKYCAKNLIGSVFPSAGNNLLTMLTGACRV